MNLKTGRMFIQEERKRAERNLAPEPAPDCQLPVTNIRIRLPSGEQVERRFLLQQPLQHLFEFMTSRNLRPAEYKIFSPFPKREVPGFVFENIILNDMVLAKILTQFQFLIHFITIKEKCI